MGRENNGERSNRGERVISYIKMSIFGQFIDYVIHILS